MGLSEPSWMCQMSTEIELKFFAERDITAELEARLQQQTLLQQGESQLGNIYFDTPERQLRNWDCGLRVRSKDGHREQTLKTRGSSVGGLHQRGEFNLPVSGDWPQLADFPAEVWPEGTDVSALQQSLQPQFRTDFLRRFWLVEFQGSRIELAFDRGVIAVDERQEPLCELELELVEGNAGALFALAASLLEMGGLRLSGVSKAQRGYRLAGLSPELEVQRMGFAPVTPELSVSEALFTVLGYGVDHWQYHEELFMEQPSLASLSQLHNGIALLQQAQVLFGDLLVTLPPRPWQEALSWLDRELAWLDEAHALERLIAERGHYFKPLHCRDELLRALQARQQALPTLESFQALLRSPRYSRLMLTLCQWFYETRKLLPASPPVVVAEGEPTPLQRYAAEQLDQSWRELHGEQMMAASLDYAGYLALVGPMRRNLLAGVSFAALFDAESRDGFRLPWLNILRHMEDLAPFDVLDAVAASLSTPARLELGEWLTSRVAPKLIELDQGRQQALTMEPYWLFARAEA